MQPKSSQMLGKHFTTEPSLCIYFPLLAEPYCPPPCTPRLTPGSRIFWGLRLHSFLYSQPVGNDPLGWGGYISDLWFITVAKLVMKYYKIILWLGVTTWGTVLNGWSIKVYRTTALMSVRFSHTMNYYRLLWLLSRLFGFQNKPEVGCGGTCL